MARYSVEVEDTEGVEEGALGEETRTAGASTTFLCASMTGLAVRRGLGASTGGLKIDT